MITIHRHLRYLKYEFNTTAFIKRYLEVEGIPKFLTKEQEIEVLSKLLLYTRDTLALFEFLVELLSPGYPKIYDFKDSKLVERAKSLIFEMTALGCFYIDRYSRNFDTNEFFGEKCP